MRRLGVPVSARPTLFAALAIILSVSVLYSVSVRRAFFGDAVAFIPIDERTILLWNLSFCSRMQNQLIDLFLDFHHRLAAS